MRLSGNCFRNSRKYKHLEVPDGHACQCGQGLTGAVTKLPHRWKRMCKGNSLDNKCILCIRHKCMQANNEHLVLGCIYTAQQCDQHTQPLEVLGKSYLQCYQIFQYSANITTVQKTRHKFIVSCPYHWIDNSVNHCFFPSAALMGITQLCLPDCVHTLL